MKIDGRKIADTILSELTQEVALLKEKDIIPMLAVILIGDNPASLAYIKQKQKAAETIGAKLILSHQSFPQENSGQAAISSQTLKSLIEQYNYDPSVHGLIVQRPLPAELGDVSLALHSIKLLKDVDGFLPGSPYPVPVAAAVGEILHNIKNQISNIKNKNQKSKINKASFIRWLQKQNVVVIGRGETAGKPIADYLSRLLATSPADVATKSSGFTTSPTRRRDNRHCTTSIIHSKTSQPHEILKQADIIVSCVGKERVVIKDSLKSGVILIGVGIWRDRKGKLRGDYDEEDIGRIASFYTPTPGGVGPVNVACLMQNLVSAAKDAY